MRPAWLLLACVLVVPTGSRADVAGVPLHVSAQVLPHVRVEPREPASQTVSISTADVARGYVDVDRSYALRTNAPGRVLLQFHPRVGLTRAVDIDGLGRRFRLLDASLEISPPDARPLELSFRLWLVPTVVPGEYPLPLHLGAVVR